MRSFAPWKHDSAASSLQAPPPKRPRQPSPHHAVLRPFCVTIAAVAAGPFHSLQKGSMVPLDLAQWFLLAVLQSLRHEASTRRTEFRSRQAVVEADDPGGSVPYHRRVRERPAGHDQDAPQEAKLRTAEQTSGTSLSAHAPSRIADIKCIVINGYTP